MFVDNLPMEMDRGWLKQIFDYDGQITYMFISRKHRRANSKPFAFVRYAKLEVAEIVVKNMNGVVIRGCKLKVYMAKFKSEFGKRKSI